jgi:hypothetical protein
MGIDGAEGSSLPGLVLLITRMGHGLPWALAFPRQP